MAIRHVNDITESQGTAETDVVLAGERVFATLKLLVHLRFEVGVERAAANTLERHLRFDLARRRFPRAECGACPFPYVADELQNAVGARAAIKSVDGRGRVQAAAPEVRQPAVHRIAPRIAPLHGP